MLPKLLQPFQQLQYLREQLRNLGAKPAHEARILRAWLSAQPLDHGAQKQAAANFFPLALRQALPALHASLQNLARVRSEHPGADPFTRRLLIELNDGQILESVLLPRDGLCVSTQVGCAVGCVFCMTGKSGLLRQLGSSEIVAQVVLARQRCGVKKVVFMGMGEPAHNLENVLEAIDLLGKEGGIGHKNLVFSSVGDVRIFKAFEQLLQQADSVKPALALSLHSTDPALRRQLLPNAPPLAPETLIELGERYARATRYPIQYQWTLIKGVNDGEDEIRRLIKLLSGKYAMMNFIPYNRVDALAFERPRAEHAQALVEKLRQHGIIAYLRDSAGQDIEAACGQLRARAVQLKRR